jgi:adenylylsulfate kinase
LSNQKLVWHSSLITREQREAMNGHKAMVVWFTGLPGSGKSTAAHAVEQQLFNAGCQAYVLDGDNVRHGLSSDLGFSPADRSEHMRRVGELAKLMYTTGMIILCAFISPMRESRRKVRALLPLGAFLEIYCKCPVELCEQRDRKGFYAQARTGKIPDYTGVSAPYEEPRDPELLLDTAALSPEQCAEHIVALLVQRDVIPRVAGDRTTTQKRT